MSGVAQEASVIGLPTRQRECYCTVVEFAGLLSVSVSTVRRWIAEGMPSETWGLRARRILPSVALAWVRTRRYAAADNYKVPPRPLERPGGVAQGVWLHEHP